MVEKFIAPKTSSEIAQQVYQEIVEDQTAFLKREAQILEAENVYFLEKKLAGGILVSVLEGRFAASRIMAGAFFRYECTRRQLAKVGSQVPFMGPGTFLKSTQELRSSLPTVSPLLVVSLTPEKPLARLNRLRITRINDDDPAIGEILKELTQESHLVREVNDTYSFTEGVHGAHLDLVVLDGAEPTEIDTPEILPSVVPAVRGEIVRTALLKTILDPREFIDQTLTRLLDYAPSMVNRIHRISLSIGQDLDSYSLLASLTAYCLMEEYQARGIRFPTIRDSEIVHPDPEIARGLRSGGNSPVTDLMIEQFNRSILKEIAATNSRLAGGIECYLRYFLEVADRDQGLQYAGAINGTVNTYATIKSAVDS